MQAKRFTTCVVLVGLMAAPLAAQTTADKMLTPGEASAIARAALPGTIAEAELDTFEGKPAYDIEVVNENGEEIEFKVDAMTSEILNIWTDDDPTDDPGDDPGAATLEELTFLIPGYAGGGWDTAARALGGAFTAAGVAEDLSFENRDGENGGIGLSYMIDSADMLANTLMLNTTQIVTRSLNGSYSASYAALTPVAAPVGDFAAFVVHPDSPIQAMADLLASYQNDASGFAIGGGSAPMGTDHLICAMVMAAADADPGFRYVQFDAVEPAFGALVAGEVAALTTEYSRALSLHEQGTLRILGVTAPADVPLAVGVASLQAQGVDMDFTTWTGFFAAPGTSAQMVDGYGAAFTALYQTGAWSEAVTENNWIELRADAGHFASELDKQHKQLGAILAKLAEK